MIIFMKKAYNKMTWKFGLFNLDFVFGKNFRGAYGHMMAMSERDMIRSFSYPYSKYMEKDFKSIRTLYDMEAVIYSKTDLNCFGYTWHKVPNKHYCKNCSDAREKHIIRIVSSKLIPEDVRKYIQDHQNHPVTEVLFTTGSVNNLFGIHNGVRWK